MWWLSCNFNRFIQSKAKQNIAIYSFSLNIQRFYWPYQSWFATITGKYTHRTAIKWCTWWKICLIFYNMTTIYKFFLDGWASVDVCVREWFYRHDFLLINELLLKEWILQSKKIVSWNTFSHSGIKYIRRNENGIFHILSDLTLNI